MLSTNSTKDYNEVKRTAQLAILHKRSSVAAGYYEDDYIHTFVDPENQIPSISITYTIRVSSIRVVIDTFINSFRHSTVQVVNLGVGLDTISFYLLKNHSNIVCFDTDFETQLKLKSDLMSNHSVFKELIPDLTLVDGLFTSSKYKMVPLDLSNTDEFQRLIDSGLSKEVPTIFVAEAVFMYIDPEIANRTIKYISESCNGPSCYVSWEVTGPDDYFGEVINRKFNEHNIKLPAFHKYKDAEAHAARYKMMGWDSAYAIYCNRFWNLFPESERNRIKSIQPFNEMEELGLMVGHNLSCVASKNIDHSSVFDKILRYTQDKNEKSKLYMKDIGYLNENQSDHLNKQFFETFFDEVFKRLN